MARIKTWWSELPTETLVETAWERQMSISGLEAFENARDTRSASETFAGQKTIRKMLEDATKGIRQMQSEVITMNRVDRGAKASVIIIPADTAALLTLRALIDKTYTASDAVVGTNYQALAKGVSMSIELELNFRNWIQSSREASKAYAKANGLMRVPKSYAERVLLEEGVSRSSLFRWRKTFDELSVYKWNELEKHYCGDALLQAVVSALPESFIIHSPFIKGKQMKLAAMTDTFRKKFDEMESKMAAMQVVRKPMLAKPKPWTRTE